MSLKKYREKRKFDRTPEPSGGGGKPKGALRYVIQKHDASHLHYDFRLELDGVLKSWAVPKGPSLNPADKRLAMMVEDHPLEYRKFHGIIPEGEYGAGTVEIWDEGVYRPAGAGRAGSSKDEAEILRRQLREGHLAFVLEGKRLRGEFALVKMKRPQYGKDNAWLLIKARDGGFPKSRPARSDRMPHNVKPMLATLVDEPFDRVGWIFEIKWDGYRAISEIENGKVKLYSRSGLSFYSRFKAVAESLRALGHDAVLDGEVVALDEAGKSHFQLLQNYQKTGKGILVYYVFDILYLDGRDLRALPLLERKEALKKALMDLPHVKYGDHISTKGKKLFELAEEQGLEGIVAKNGDSAYQTGKRSRDWLKIKTKLRQEAIVVGYTDPLRSRKYFGSLALGIYRGPELTYIGQSGGGFDSQSLKEIFGKMQPLREDSPPVANPPRGKKIHWVRPSLVCEVSFSEWSQDGLMRQPVFQGLRVDKKPKEVKREEPEPVKPAKSAAAVKRHAKRHASAERDATVKIGGRELSLTHLDKVFWPDEGYTKGDLIDYYRRIAPRIMPYLKGRPQTLHRYPDGIAGERSFYQKDTSGLHLPDWIRTVRKPAEDRHVVEYVVCDNEAGLIYLANLGCVEMNVWNSRVGSWDNPDYCVIDLDPEDISFDKVMEVALAVKEVLDEIGADGYPKTSGGRGIHIYIPLGAKYGHAESRTFAELIANMTRKLVPEITSLERSPSKRQKKVYLDYLQNARGQTLAAPYCVRPKPHATVSTPLKWSELKRGVEPADFTIETIGRRLDKVGDLWTPVLGKGIDLKKILSKLRNEAE